MKNLARVMALAVAAVVLTTAGVALASEFKSPAEILSRISGEPAEDLREQRLEGKPYGEIAEDYDKLDEFRQQMLAQKKAILDQRVEEGYLTREEADEIEQRLGTFCGDETRGLCGQGYGAGFGMRYGGDRDGEGKREDMAQNGFGKSNDMSRDGQGRKPNMLQNGQGRGPGRGPGMGFGR